MNKENGTQPKRISASCSDRENIPDIYLL